MYSSLRTDHIEPVRYRGYGALTATWLHSIDPADQRDFSGGYFRYSVHTSGCSHVANYHLSTIPVWGVHDMMVNHSVPFMNTLLPDSKTKLIGCCTDGAPLMTANEKALRHGWAGLRPAVLLNLVWFTPTGSSREARYHKFDVWGQRRGILPSGRQ